MRFHKCFDMDRWPAWLPGLIVACAGVFLLFRGLLGRDIGGTLWCSDFDAHLEYWIFDWGYRAITEPSLWGRFWDANAFYPHSNSLAFSDSLVSGQIVYAPLRLMGMPPLAAMYATFAVFCVAGAASTDYALRRLGMASALERAFVVYAAHFSLPVVSYLGHYQFFAFELVPPFLLFLHLYMRTLRLAHLVAAVFLFVIAACFAGYLVLMMGIIGAAVVIVDLPQCFRTQGIRHCVIAFARAAAVSAATAVFLYLVQFRAYLNLSESFPEHSESEIEMYSANILSLFRTASMISYWYKPVQHSVWGEGEYAYFPGWLLLAAAVVGAAACARSVVCRLRRVAAEPAATPDACNFAGLSRFAVAVFLASWLLSLGPTLTLYSTTVPGPYAWLSAVIPGFDSLRVPGRFGMFFGLSLGILAVCGVRLAGARFPQRRRIIGIAAAVLLAVDSLAVFRVHEFRIEHRAFYEAARAHIRPGEPVLVLPVSRGDHMGTIKLRMEQLKGSTIHKGRIVTGYGARDTAELGELTHLDNLFRTGNGAFDAFASFAERLGIRKFLVFWSEYDPARRDMVRGFVHGGTNARVLIENEEGVLFETGAAGK